MIYLYDIAGRAYGPSVDRARIVGANRRLVAGIVGLSTAIFFGNTVLLADNVPIAGRSKRRLVGGCFFLRLTIIAWVVGHFALPTAPLPKEWGT